MPLVLGILLVVAAVAVCLWLSITALNQVKQLRAELDETQRQLNELKAAAEVIPAPPPPPLPRSRSSGLDDLREQLRAAHREESPPDE
jgi:hypothetical protein